MKKRLSVDPHNCTAEETISILDLVGRGLRRECEQSKEERNCLIGTSVGSIRHERDAKGRKAQEVVPRAEISSRRRRKYLLVTNLPDFSRKKLESAFFRDRRDSIYKLNRVGAHATRLTPTGLMPVTRISVYIFFFASSPGDSSSLCLILSFVFVRTLASFYSRLRSNGVALFAPRIFSVIQRSSL